MGKKIIIDYFSKLVGGIDRSVDNTLDQAQECGFADGGESTEGKKLFVSIQPQ